MFSIQTKNHAVLSLHSQIQEKRELSRPTWVHILFQYRHFTGAFDLFFFTKNDSSYSAVVRWGKVAFTHVCHGPPLPMHTSICKSVLAGFVASLKSPLIIKPGYWIASLIIRFNRFNLVFKFSQAVLNRFTTDDSTDSTLLEGKNCSCTWRTVCYCWWSPSGETSCHPSADLFFLFFNLFVFILCCSTEIHFYFGADLISVISVQAFFTEI